jgi:hypothetical protein
MNKKEALESQEGDFHLPTALNYEKSGRISSKRGIN